MKSMAKCIPFLFIAAVILSACDPGYSGHIHVQNDTPHTLRIISATNDTDTVATDIAPYSSQSVQEFGGVKSGKQFGCCPCEFYSTLQPADSGKTLLKNINDPDQWLVDNPNKSVFHNKEIRCTFTVTEADIQ